MTDEPATGHEPRIIVERTQTGVRMEKRMLKVLKGLAEYFEISLGDLLEGIVLHAIEGKSPFGPEAIQRIEGLKQIYDMDYDSRASHHFVEHDLDDGPTQIAVVCLPTDDAPAAVLFYRDALGLRPAVDHAEPPHFEVGQMRLVIGAGAPIAIEVGAQPFPVVAFDVPDLDRAIERLQKHGVELSDSIVETENCRWIKLHDPAGNLIELVQYY